MLQIEGEKIILKEFTKDNLYDEKYFSWLRDPEIVSQLYRIEYLLPISFVEVEKYVESVWDSKNDCFFAVYLKENNEFIGTQKIGHINWRSGIGDVGIMIGAKSHQGKGLSKDILNTAMGYAFNYLCLRKLTGGTSQNNLAMQKCFEGLGFKKEGTLRLQLLINGKYRDHLLYGILKDEFTL